MLWYTHVAIGAAVGIVINSTSMKEAIIAATISGAAALIPDIDTPSSKLGRKRPIISKAINFIFGHRGVMHSLAGCIAIFFIFQKILPDSMMCLTRYIGMGYMSHIIADMFNPAGVPLLWPIRKRYKMPIVKTGGFVENILFTATVIFILLKLEQISVY